MELGHLLTRSGLTYPEVSSNVCHDSICQMGNSVSLRWVIYYKLILKPNFSEVFDFVMQRQSEYLL
jgi:hypothetical protein